MKEFVISEAKAETAVLVGLITNEQDEAKTKEYLDELEFLADTAGAVTVKRFTQKVNGPSSVTYVGSGKLAEIRKYIEDEAEADREVGMVIFDDELSAKQMRNIEKELKVKILDRTSLILDIFAMRAQTAEAKTQVELAQAVGMDKSTLSRVMAEKTSKLSSKNLVAREAARAPGEARAAWVCAARARRSSRWTAASYCSA